MELIRLIFICYMIMQPNLPEVFLSFDDGEFSMTYDTTKYTEQEAFELVKGWVDEKLGIKRI